MNDINKVLERNYQFNASEFVSKGYDIMKSQMGPFIGMTLLFIIIQYIIRLIPFVSVVASLVDNCLYAGYFIYCRNILLNRQETSDFFRGFDHVGQIVLHLLIYFLFLVPFMILLFTAIIPWDVWAELINSGFDSEQLIIDIMGGQYLNGWLAIVSGIVCLIGFLYLSISYLFTIPLIVDAKLGYWEAMELSRKVIGEKFFTFLGYMILGGILVGLGVAITCGIGALFLIPLVHCTIFAAYNEIFKPYEEVSQNHIDSFGQLDEDINTEAQEKDNY